MCGIVGVAGNTYPKHEEIFNNMLVFDTVRGLDSTGVLYVGTTDGKHEIIKTLGSPFSLPPKSSGYSSTSHMLMLGHNRKGTKGAISIENAHPIEEGDIIGVHNGTLFNYDDLLDDGDKIDLDSRAIYRSISKNGIDFTWKNLWGDAALVWWNKKDNTLNMIRNEGRPLYVARGGYNNTILYFASEPWMIEVAVERNKETLEKCEEEGKKNKNELISLKPHHLHKFEVTSMNCKLVEVRELEKKSLPTTTTIYNGGRIGSNPIGFRSNNSFKNPARNRPTSPRPKKSGGKKPYSFKWTDNTTKADKSLRGLQFRLTAHISEPYIKTDRKSYFTGWTIEKPSQRVEVYPVNEEQEQNIRKKWMECGSDLLCSFSSKPRIYDYDDGTITFRTSTSTIEILNKSKSKVTVVEEEEKDGEVIFLTDLNLSPKLFYKGNFLPRKTFLAHLSSVTKDGCCIACGDPINPEEAKDLHWVTKYSNSGDIACMCPKCASSKETVTQIHAFLGA